MDSSFENDLRAKGVDSFTINILKGKKTRKITYYDYKLKYIFVIFLYNAKNY